MTISRKCGNCRFWKAGDPISAIGNKGACTALAYGDRPFWAAGVLMLTISWEGTSCGAYSQRADAQPDGPGRAL